MHIAARPESKEDIATGAMRNMIFLTGPFGEEKKGKDLVRKDKMV